MYAARKLKKVGKYTIGRLLGEGGFGKVFLGSDTETNKAVAIKFIDRSLVVQRHLEEYVMREIETLKALKHKHIVQLYEVIEKPAIYYIVMELAPNGELFDKIVEARKFDEATARRYFQQLMSAVAYCHARGIAHRDLKAENLLLGSNDVLKVCDFGLARPAIEEHGEEFNELYMTSLAGSQDYQAPEMRTQSQYLGFPCDIWSCGVILYFMLCGYLPFAERADDATDRRIREGRFRNDTAQYKGLSAEAKSLIESILVVDVSKRATIVDIVQHPWFAMDLDPKLMEMTPIGSPHHLNGSQSPALAGSPNSLGHGGMPRSGSRGELMSPTRGLATSPFPSSGSIYGSFSGTQTNRELLAKAFRSCNLRHDGFLTQVDIRDILIKLNNNKEVPMSEVEEIMSKFTLDEAGRLTEDAFVDAWFGPNGSTLEGKLHVSNLLHIFHINVERELLDTIRRAFDAIDADKIGIITQANLAHNTELVKSMTPEEFEHLKNDIGTDGVNFEQFVDLLTKTSLIQNNPKLLTLAPLFEAYDFEGFSKKLKIGFTVAGLRQTIYEKLVKAGQDPEGKFRTAFHEAEESQSFVYGEHTPVGSTNPSLKIGLQLLPTARGYTRVRTYRISGDTTKYHEWFRMLRFLLQVETEQCLKDTMVRGESELL
jgi:serine/threonine protein kinase